MKKIKVEKLFQIANNDELNEYEKHVVINEVHSLMIKNKKKIKYKKLILDLVDSSVKCENNFCLKTSLSINRILKLLKEQIEL